MSVEDLKTNYRRLQVDFDLWYGESDAEPYVEPLLARLRERNLLRESEGALVVDVEEEGDKAPMPPVIVKKKRQFQHIRHHRPGDHSAAGTRLCPGGDLVRGG